MTVAPTTERWTPTEYLLDELCTYDAGIDMNLENNDLSGLDLTGINLQGAQLIGASLQGTCLRNANLDRALLIGVDTDAADLTAASLTQTIIIDAPLAHTTLSAVHTAGPIEMPSWLVSILLQPWLAVASPGAVLVRQAS